jgi:type IX secretion system PorP/SprF family membrane protein
MGRLRGIILIVIYLVHCRSFGQGDPDSSRIVLGYPVYSQYLHNGLMINPAYAGSRDALSAVISYRMQWMGINDAPRIESVSLHTPMKNDKVALGFKAQFMRYGVTKSQSIYAVYAYHIRLARGKISFGLKAGADLSNTDYTGLLGISRPDPAFPDNDKSYVFPNAGAGVYYFSNRFFAGFSVPSFLFYKNTGNGNVQAYHAFNEYDFVVSAGGLIEFSQVFKFKPSVLLDYSMHDTKHINQFDINGNFIFADFIWAGASWRTTEQVAVGHLQVQISQQLMLGISYDYPAGRMNSYSKGSSEFMLRYEFGSRVSAANPRYF